MSKCYYKQGGFMKKITALFLSLAVVLGIFMIQGCSQKRGPGAVTGIENSVSSQSCDPKKGTNVFAGNFYSECKTTTAGNIFFSPYSIFAALSMTYEGAKGETAGQMAVLLHLQSDAATRQAGFASMMNAINAPGKSYTLSTSNNLWIQQGFPVLQSYTTVLTQYYLAAITLLDFINSPEASRQTINNAVAGQTNNKITNLIPPGDITSFTRLVLTNAVYMDATWADKFPAANTHTGSFYTTASSPVSVSIMSQTMPGNIENYYGAAQVMEMPYVNNELSMFVFLPPQGQMAALESVMTGDKLNDWFANRSSAAAVTGSVIVLLPKFTFTENYDLTSMLQNMGMVLAFNSAADFSGIAPKSYGPLYVSDVVHKAYVSVDENGTEAAAATAVIFTTTIECVTVPINQPPVFNVDSPFIFVIRENTTNAILFMGRVMDPTSN
jgi:serpin B